MTRLVTLVGRVGLAAALALAAGACGDDGDDPGATTTTAPADTTTSSTAAPATTATTAGDTTTSTTGAAAPDVPVLFPTGDQGAATPEEAADGFMAAYFSDTDYTLDAFQQGDATSGELPVLRHREDGGVGTLGATLLLRNEGAGWFVIGAVNPSVTIDTPEAGATVAAGPLAVEGTGRGFEATIVVTAVPQGGGALVDVQVGQGGAFADPEPYEVQLDLAAARPGETLAIIAAGGVGLERDTGEFSAIPVVVAP